MAAQGSDRTGPDASTEAGPDAEALPASAIYDIDTVDPGQLLVDRGGIAPADTRQITELMAALGQLRIAEQRLAEASRRYMRLNDTDMRALHFLIACTHQDAIATPGAIAGHLGISTAATTKLLDRLERGGHITRSAHPTDRRAMRIAITPETHRAAMATVGRQQARRFHAAARLTLAERDVVIRFIRDMTDELALGDASWAQHGDGHET